MGKGVIETYTGVMFDVFNPKPEMFVIQDIAHALSLTCRYNGHSPWFYSVAQHSCILADLADFSYGPKYGVTALLHDLSEAYITDLPRPVKLKLPDYEDLEATLMEAAAEKFDFIWPLPLEVNQLDYNILLNEKLAFNGGNLVAARKWLECDEALEPLNIPKWRFEKAIPSTIEYWFLDTYQTLKEQYSNEFTSGRLGGNETAPPSTNNWRGYAADGLAV